MSTVLAALKLSCIFTFYSCREQAARRALMRSSQWCPCTTWAGSSPAPSVVNSASVPHKNANRFSCGLQSLTGSAITVVTNTKPAKAAFAEAPARAQLPKSSSSQPWTPVQLASALLLVCGSFPSRLLHHGLDCRHGPQKRGASAHEQAHPTQHCLHAQSCSWQR